jgi:hypothetical protein
LNRIQAFACCLSFAGCAFAQGPPTGIVKQGVILLVRTESKTARGSAPATENITDVITGGFRLTDYTNYTPIAAPPVTTIGPCTVTMLSPPQDNSNVTPLPTSPLDAGPVLNVSGPNGSLQIPARNNNFSMTLGGSALPIPGAGAPTPPYLDPGTYTIDNGGGGADVGPFSATLTVPPTLVWTNADADLTVVRANGVDIQWTGGDPAANVGISGGVTIVDPATFKITGGAVFGCDVPNTGEFVVTPDVLSLMPATPTGPVAAAFSTLTIADTAGATFTASGIDMGGIIFSAGSGRSVVYQ